ncbi:MAG TPA: chromosome segregation protein SMC [Bacillota bacterium]|nr:chromosome segregation protein SMC [Bacillota bacterium]
MHLKRLEIQGFKSFADKMDFQFTNGVTIVVGPNGSGKSNISDSIRWVLGEQSAKSLRGAKMEDIIFSGSDRRKPVGMAEVSMTVDNADGRLPLDFSEVTVTRRVYRSGESEFLINKVPCRLRDIHELFMDTGIGRETYSIIGQGKVEQILSARPEERRTLIEEAAGITKYRSRKQEALRKLDDTQLNLNRVNDIIIELEGQIEPLAEQAERAQAYREFRSELVALEVNLLVNQLDEQKQRLAECCQLSERLRSQLLAEENVTLLQEASLEELRLKLAKLDEEITAKQQAIFEITNATERSEGEIKVRTERINGLDEQQERLRSEIEECQDKLAALDTEYSEEAGRGQALGETVESTMASLAAKEAQLAELEASMTSGEKAVEESKGDIIELLNRMANTRNELAGLNVGMSASQKRAEQLAQSKTLERTALADRQERLADLQEQAEHGRITLEQWVKESEYTRSVKDEGQAKLAALAEQLANEQSRWQAKHSRYRVLQELQQHFEGYQKGVREVLQAKQKGDPRCQDVCGVVAELIKVPGRYEVAIEVALGGALQNLVTTMDVGAKAAIGYLKENKLGRATFLPLNTIQGQNLRPEEEKALTMPGGPGASLPVGSV